MKDTKTTTSRPDEGEGQVLFDMQGFRPEGFDAMNIEYRPDTAHRRLCEEIKKLAMERKTGAAKQIGRLLKQAEEPLDVWTARQLGEFLCPEKKLNRGAKPDAALDKYRKYVEVAWTLGELQRMIGEAEGPVDWLDAREMACEKLVDLDCGMTTLKKIINQKGPMVRVVGWARDGVRPTKADLKQLRKDFEEWVGADEKGSPI